MPCQSVTADYEFRYVQGGPVFTGGSTDRIISMNSTIGLGSESSNLNFVVAGNPTNNYGIIARANVGQAVLFRCNNFEFGGVLKSIVSEENDNGITTKVNVVCAKELLAKYDLLLNKGICGGGTFSRSKVHGSIRVSISSAINGRNIHADLEQFSLDGRACSAGGLGGFLPKGADCSQYGRANEGIVSRGSTTYRAIMAALMQNGARVWCWGGLQAIPINFSPIASLALSIPYAATSAHKMTLLDVVNAICDEAGYDFHCTIRGGWVQFILVNKRIETVFGTVQNIVEKAKQNKNCISSGIGAESKNEKTNRVVVGSFAHYIKEVDVTGSNKLGLVLGFDGSNPIYTTEPDFNLRYPTHRLGAALSAVGFSFSDYHNISERELIASGSIDSWKLFGLENPASLSRSCMNACGLNWNQGVGLIRKYGSAHYVGRSAVEAVKTLANRGSSSAAYEDICWPFFRSIFETYYGKYYLVMLNSSNFTCFQDTTGYIGSTGNFLGEGGAGHLMDQPVNAGWPDDENRVLGLSDLHLFKDSSGRLQCFARIPKFHTINRNIYSSTLDLSSFGGDYILSGNNAFVKMDVDGRAYNRNGNFSILVKCPSMIPQRVNLAVPSNIAQGFRAISLCYGVVQNPGGGGGTNSDSYVNIFKENVAAGGFYNIALPFRNNQITYGPWAAGNGIGSGGGVDIQIREDLNPWEYGGYGPMNNAGGTIASQGLPFRTRYESGHVTIAESPAESLGSQNAGPLLASIVVKFDKNGATTTYNYETYKPKFGNYAENFNEYIKKNVSDRRDNYNILRETYLETIRNSNQSLRVAQSIRDKTGGPSYLNYAGAFSATQSQIIFASHPSTFPGQIQNSKIEAGILKSHDSDYIQDRNNYSDYAAVGMDMFFSPVGINSSSANMANMQPKQSTPVNGSIPSMPPFLVNGTLQSGGNSKITNMVLNPYTTRQMVSDHFQGKGFSYGIQTDYLTFNNDPYKLLDVDNEKQNQTNLRAVAHRGPLLLHGWGYDINGKPVPNQDPKKPTDRFTTNWLSNPQKWPVGPVDLRWDEKRGVWTAPSSTERLVVAQLTSNLSLGGSAEAVLIISDLYEDVFDDDGNPIKVSDSILSCKDYGSSSSYAKITVLDIIGRPANIGSRVVAYHIGKGLYIPLMIADTYKKGPSSSCCPEEKSKKGPAHPCYSNEESECGKIGLVAIEDFSPLMVEGIDKSGMKVLHNLISAFVSPDIYEDPGNGETKVLAYTKKNSYGFPCMTGVPIVNCTGEYPGSGDPPVGGCDCPPGQVCYQGRCVGF